MIWTPPQVHFVGRSGSGKTTLIATLIEYWTARGLRIGAVKHASKAFQMDHRGKDSHRFRSSGAAGVAIASPTEFAVISTTETPMTSADLVAQLPADLDAILVEGFKGDGGLTLEVHRGSRPLLALSGRFAVVTDRPGAHAIDVPQLHIDDISGLAAFLERRLELTAIGQRRAG